MVEEAIQDRQVSNSLSYRLRDLKELHEGWNRVKSGKGKADGDGVREQKVQ